MKDHVEQYCVTELYRMYDGHRRAANILYDLADSATQPLLATTLREQVAAHTRCLEQLETCFEFLGVEAQEVPNTEVAVMVLEAGAEEDAPDAAVRDMMIAQSAIRLEHYMIANYKGLASWFRQLGKHGVGSTIEAMMQRIGRAEAHLEALQPGLSALFHDEPHVYKPKGTPRPAERTQHSDLEGYER